MAKMLELVDINRQAEDKNVMLLFKGDISSDLLNSILQLIEHKLADEPPRLKKRIFIILVECLQNLYHHIDIDHEDVDESKKAGVIMVGRDPNGYSVYTGNLVHHKSANTLREKLAYINALSPEELKDLYKVKLADGERSEKGGGGLGIIDIARRSGEKLEYGFVPFDKGHSFFSLNVKIN